ncbi:2-octaprenyl-6-methoxyphenol hydroxylase [Candidatus Bealeia paramacronuclearis]|uniref:2-octaprenyl-6-methoxyphenol hydroxylase n=1 Tax=Candidatus Bealeia paramacronuclearis TaxID=1921001 RepID=A0ABZ2C2K3_9PROT|nr:2-octaprenyl-6-methoxyphenol hydroxylase [Candidatus Bealeia paramacronuclearis]
MGRQKNKLLDVIICGGGFTGSLMAKALSDQGLEVAIFDKRDFRTPLTQDGRTFAITLGSQIYLETLGIWEKLKSDPTPISHILITDHKSDHRLHYDAKALGLGPMGYMVTAEDLDQALKASLSNSKNIQFVESDEVVEMKSNISQIQMTLKSGRILKATLVIAADGKNSKLRDLAGLASKTIPYHQHAIVGVVSHEKPHHHIAFEHFTPFGPLAFLPLAGNTSAFVWSLETEKSEVMMTLKDVEFCQELESTFGETLGRFQFQGLRQSYPLSLTTCRAIASDRLVLIGDAAHAMHPVAGQGLNLGIRDVESFSTALREAQKLGLDFGSPTLLENYVKSRKWDQTSLLSSTHGLIRLFGNSSRFLRFMRGSGLSLVNSIKPLKLFFMKRAMGVE